MEMNKPLVEMIDETENQVHRFYIHLKSFINFVSAEGKVFEQILLLQQKANALNEIKKLNLHSGNRSGFIQELESIHSIISVIHISLDELNCCNEFTQEKNKLIVDSLFILNLLNENLIKLQE